MAKELCRTKLFEEYVPDSNIDLNTITYTPTPLRLLNRKKSFTLIPIDIPKYIGSRYKGIKFTLVHVDEHVLIDSSKKVLQDPRLRFASNAYSVTITDHQINENQSANNAEGRCVNTAAMNDAHTIMNYTNRTESENFQVIVNTVTSRVDANLPIPQISYLHSDTSLHNKNSISNSDLGDDMREQISNPEDECKERLPKSLWNEEILTLHEEKSFLFQKFQKHNKFCKKRPCNRGKDCLRFVYYKKLKSLKYHKRRLFDELLKTYSRSQLNEMYIKEFKKSR